MTQDELARKAGMDRSWYNQMERGKRPITRSPAVKLADILGVSPAELGVDDETAPEHRSLVDRQGELEAEVLRLQKTVHRLVRQVRLLERRSPGESRGEATGRE